MLQVSEDVKTNYYKEFNTDEKRVTEDVRIIKEWLEGQKHLPEIMEDVKIRNFLFMNKFSIERTKQKIDNYYTMRTLLPEAFATPTPETIERSFLTAEYCFIPKLTKKMHRIHIWRTTGLGALDVETWLTMFFAGFEIRLCEDIITNDIFIADYAGMTFNNMKRISPSVVTKFFHIYQKVYSLRLYKFYFINSPSFISILVSMLKVALKPKIFQRIEVCESADILDRIFSKDEIPKDYGGSAPSVVELTDTLKQKLRDNKNMFDRLNALKVNESLRPEKLNNDELLGFYGNFKKIEID